MQFTETFNKNKHISIFNKKKIEKKGRKVYYALYLTTYVKLCGMFTISTVNKNVVRSLIAFTKTEL